LSGFVLTLAAEPGMASRSPWRFFTSRVRRLWPLVTIGTLAGALSFLPDAPLGQLATLTGLAVLMVPQLQPGFAIFPLNAPQWSLMWELLANALHAVILHRLEQRALWAVVAAAGVGVIWSISTFGSCRMGPNAESWWMAGPRVIWAYGLGIAMARRWRQKRPAPLTSWQIALVAPLAALVALPWLPLSEAVGDGLVTLIVMPALFWISTTVVPSESAGVTLQRVGAISFPLYALHLPVLVAGSYISVTPAARIAAAATALGLATLAAHYGKLRNGQLTSRPRPRVLPAT